MSDLLNPASPRLEKLIQTRSEHNTIYVCKYNHNIQHVADNKKYPIHIAVIPGDAFSHTARNSEKGGRKVFRKMNLTATQLWGKKPFLNNMVVNYTMINLNRNVRILIWTMKQQQKPE